jgi:hypothetical protein
MVPSFIAAGFTFIALSATGSFKSELSSMSPTQEGTEKD